MQIAHIPSELNPADPISRWWWGQSAKDVVVLARARHWCLVRTAQSPPWGVVGDRDCQLWVGYQWGG